ncbi:MAG: DHHA1 domain-containing protein [Halarcobacter ebronensis]
MVFPRSKGKIDISKVISKFGGGGHANAAGCSLDGTDLEKARKKVLKEILETRKK